MGFDFASLIRDVADFPEAGIVFKDITPLLADPEGLEAALDELTGPFHDTGVTKVVGIEARGFIFGAPAADRLGAGFVPVRKPGKLPWIVETQTYSLEYGSGTLEVHRDSVQAGDSVLIVDDVLATGGTARATVDLVRKLGAGVAGVAVLIELGFLNGRSRLDGVEVHTVVHYGGD
ncbi:MAG TPA: adenine phosphoribosyltransferase [Acidimicrobiia bacterium]|jgi:adenine phosphoribosyltransferase